jgi:hypothetical protein
MFIRNITHESFEWWYTSIVPALQEAEAGDHKFEANLGIIASSRPIWNT